MDYRIFRKSSGRNENSIEAHVFARAYRAMWRSIHGSWPQGRHEVAALELVLDFGGRALTQGGTSHEHAAPAAPGADPGRAAGDVPPGERNDE